MARTRWGGRRQEEHDVARHGSGFGPVHGKGHLRVVILPDEMVLGAAFDGIERFVRG